MKRRRRTMWKTREDLRPLLIRAKKLFPTMLGHVQTKKIFLCSYTGRKSKGVASICANKRPWCLLLPDYDYCIMFWGTRFDSMDDNHQMLVMVHELIHIPALGHQPGDGYRKLLKHDVEDFSHMLSTYGILRENVKDIMKGEKHLFKHLGGDVRRFPRMMKMG